MDSSTSTTFAKQPTSNRNGRIVWPEAFNNISTVNAVFLQKLYKCENAKLKSNGQTIVFENFKLVASSFEIFYLHYIEMVDKDINDVQLEEILASLPNVKEFKYYGYPAVTDLTMKKISQLQNLSNLREFTLDSIPEFGDVKDFENFFMKHKGTKFLLQFYGYNISVGYKSQLDDLCDTVISAKACKCVIEYRGQDEKKLAVMRECYDK